MWRRPDLVGAPFALAGRRRCFCVIKPEAAVKPEILDRKTAYAGYLKVERLTIGLAGGETALREIESHGDSVAVLPYDVERRCALIVRQPRAPVLAVTGDDSVLEACAGMIESEAAETTVRREANEELGVTVTTLEFIARVWPSPGVSTERSSLFLAPYHLGDRVGAGGGLAAEHEHITVIETPLAALAADADQGRIVDAKLLSLVQTLRVRRPELFGDPGARASSPLS